MHNPMVGRVTSEYDLKRKHPVFGTVQPHRGIDLGAPTGTLPHDYIGADVRAAYGGVVESVCTNWRSGWGAIWGRSGDGAFIRNPDGEGQYYGHLDSIDVKVGQKVTEGQVIGGMGVSGNVTGPHLHFEIHASTSGPKNNYKHTRNPRADFEAAGITPGRDAALTPAASTPKEDALSAAEVNEIKAHVTSEINRAMDYIGQRTTVDVIRNGKPTTRALSTIMDNINRAADTAAINSAVIEEKQDQLSKGLDVSLDEESIQEVRAAARAGVADGFTDEQKEN